MDSHGTNETREAILEGQRQLRSSRVKRPFQQLKRFWQLDHAAGKPQDAVALSIEDQRAKQIMDETIDLKNGHYEVGLPWKHVPPYLPNNRPMAEARLRYLKNKFQKDGEFFTTYRTTMEDYIDKGYAEEAPTSDTASPVWYLPHHPVMHPHKPEKMRVVYDCAARYKGTSLNDHILRGPDYTKSCRGPDKVPTRTSSCIRGHRGHVPPGESTNQGSRRTLVSLVERR